MVTQKHGSVAPYLQRLFNEGTLRDLSDGQIMERFTTADGDIAERAFEALVERHGPMVLSVCRGIVTDPQDAEDAFQATFLVLLKRGAKLWTYDSLGPWLYQVAHRVSSRARSSAARRHKHEQAAAVERAADSSLDDAIIEQELRHTLHDEINRLPHGYRVAIVLCDLEGRTCEQAARHVGCPVGTLKSWRARGRERLRSRLAARGWAPSAIPLAAALGSAQFVPRVLTESTVKAVMWITSNAGGRGTLVTTAVELAQRALLPAFLSRIRTIAVGITLVGVTAAGVKLGMHAEVAADHEPPQSGEVRPNVNTRPIQLVLEEAARAAESTPDPQSRAYALTEIAKAQTRAADSVGAVRSTQQATSAALKLKADTQCLALATIACAQENAGNREGALNVLQLASRCAARIESVPEHIRILGIVAALRFEFGDRNGATVVVKSMAEKVRAMDVSRTERFAVCGELVKAEAMTGDVEGAFRTIATVGAGQRYLQGSLMATLAEAMSSEHVFYYRARKPFSPEERKARLAVIQRIAKVVETFEFAEQKPYARLAIALARLGDGKGARRLMQMSGKGPTEFRHLIDPTDSAFVLAIIGASEAKAGRSEKAREAFREALQDVRRDPTLMFRLEQIASMQAKAGDCAGRCGR